MGTIRAVPVNFSVLNSPTNEGGRTVIIIPLQCTSRVHVTRFRLNFTRPILQRPEDVHDVTKSKFGRAMKMAPRENLKCNMTMQIQKMKNLT